MLAAFRHRFSLLSPRLDRAPVAARASPAAQESVQRDLASWGTSGATRAQHRDVARLAALRVMVRGGLTRDDRAGKPRHGAREQEASKQESATAN